MNIEKLQLVLSVIGAVLIGVPALLRALVIFFKLIPGDQPDKAIEKLLAISDKIAEVAVKLFPRTKA